MSKPMTVPPQQSLAFRKAMADRLGLDLAEIGDDFAVGFEIDGRGGARVTFSGTAFLSADEVSAMFNGATR